jgi:glycosyltransferase involved in cell wall biosynthesis
LVLIEYELFPWFPALFERLLAWRGCRMVVDYDDALFHQYDAHPNPWVRRLLGSKIATVMRLAHTVVVGNAYLAAYARSAGARRVELIPTVVDLVRYRVKDAARNSDNFTIGWIGSPSTARYLHEIAPALARLCRDGRARVRVVGSGPLNLPGVAMEVVAWSEETEVEEILGFDVGVMPLPDEPWARGKCGFKLVQYMACALPVVASPVGVNSEIVEDGVNGFLACGEADWVAALERLKENAALGKRLGKEGRRKVEEQYCLQVTGARFAALLLAVREAA